MLAGVLAPSSLLRGEEPALPKYKLDVGQELVYRTTDPPAEQGEGDNKYSRQVVTEWRVNVIDRRDDDTWRLVFVQKLSVTYVRGGKEDKQQLAVDGYVDLAPDGRFQENPTLGPLANPSIIFPPLPPEANAKAWSASLSIDETKREFTASPESTAAAFRFGEVAHTIFDPIYEMSTRRDYAFDVAKGLVSKVTTTTTSGWPRPEPPSVQTIELVSLRQLEGVDREKFAAEMGRYLEARETYESQADEARSDFSRAAPLMSAAKRTLGDLRGQLTLPDVQKLVDDKLEEHERSEKFVLGDAVKFAPLMNQPAPDWKTTDLDGNPKSLSDYRGQVVLLDFWYRGCGWCTRAMPQLKQLAADFEGQQVALLGVNNDRNLDDARVVINAMALNYPTLKNGEGADSISAKFKINGWPTFVMIDQEGVVRYIHFGYQPTLRQVVGDKIRELLAKSAAPK
jgi:thiol-disulfide isomerase/thioredoxin